MTHDTAELAALRALDTGVESLSEYIERMTPKHAPVPQHLERMVSILEATRHGEVFATISQPPRHGKTVTIAHGLAYRTLYDPACLNFYATFGEALSQHTSRMVRRLVRASGVPLSPEAQSVDDWRTIAEGGLKATSVGGDVTGRGCNGGLIVCDDIVKGRAQAESKLVRDRAWDWLRDDIMSRLEPGASMIVNATRWHEDDPIGRLMHDGLGHKWIHLKLPAVRGLDGKATDEREDPNAIPLWPEGGYDLERYKQIRLRGEHGWWSLYQGRPTPRGGGMFQGKWFNYVDAMPAGGNIIRRWDLAASTERDSAFTVGSLVKMVDDKLFVGDVVRGQWSAHERDEKIAETAERDGRAVSIWFPQDPGQAGKSQKPHLAKLLSGFIVHFEIERKEKDVRAEPYASQCEAGNVFLVRAPWNRPFIDEHESFPAGKLKDQVDTMSGAYGVLIAMRPRAVPQGGVLGVAGSSGTRQELSDDEPSSSTATSIAGLLGGFGGS